MKSLIASMAIVALAAMLVGTAVLATDTGNISATVTASVIAMTVTDGSVAYGTVSTTADTTSSGVNDTQTLQNAGTVNVDFEIKGYNSTGQVWTLAGSAGDATYAHKTCKTTCDSSPSWTAITTGWTDLDTGKTPSSTTALDLQVTVPTSNSGTGVATLPIDLRATAS
jgi:hypothetical protein